MSLGRLYDNLTFKVLRMEGPQKQVAIVATADQIDFVMNQHYALAIMKEISEKVAELLTKEWLDAHKVAILDALAPGEVAKAVQEQVKERIADSVLKLKPERKQELARVGGLGGQG